MFVVKNILLHDTQNMFQHLRARSVLVLYFILPFYNNTVSDNKQQSPVDPINPIPISVDELN